MTAVDVDECFLCRPDSDLVVGGYANVFSMTGLGPITDRYLMIATKSHVRSFADIYVTDPRIAAEVEALRSRLQQNATPLLMTEHGRVPACLNGSDEHDAHCFHAHFLLFQSETDIEKLASSYFMENAAFDRLGDALAYASQSENYYLLSPETGKYVVFTEALNVPRQFFRYLVALAEDQPERADWRNRPNRERAIAAADKERILFKAQQWR